MMAKSKTFMMNVTFTLFFIFLFSLKVFADQEGTFTAYTAETADKKHLFVMLNCGDENYKNYLSDSIYKKCGMYLNDGSATPLWTVDWSGNIFLPNGGEVVVKRGKWARTSGNYQEEALTFFSHGEPLKTYSTKDLIDFPWLLLHSSSHYVWIAKSELFTSSHGVGAFTKINNNEGFDTNTGVEIDNLNKTMSVKTVFSDEIIFDLTTGEILSVYRPSRIACCVFALILITVYFLFRRKFLVSRLSSLFISAVFCFAILMLPLISIRLFFTETIEGTTFFFFTMWEVQWSVTHFPAYLLSLFGVSFVKPNAFEITEDFALLAWSLSFWTCCLISAFIFDRIYLRFIQKN
jgi:hypothetical protein